MLCARALTHPNDDKLVPDSQRANLKEVGGSESGPLKAVHLSRHTWPGVFHGLGEG